MTITVVSQTYAYGYDSGGACDPRASRKGRAQLIASIPCDLSTQSYCHLPGSFYPWKAVRNFVHENQGLMRRMYGNIRQISVLKNEFDGNYLETDEVEAASERYSEKRFRAMKFDQEPKTAQNLNKKNRKSDTILEPHFRLQSTSTTTSTTTTTTARPSTVTTKKPSGYSNSKDYYLLASNETAPIDFEIETNKLNIGNDTLKFSEQDAITVVTLSSNQNSVMNDSEILSTTKKSQEMSSTTETGLSSQEAFSGSESAEESYEHEDEFDGEVSGEDEEEEDLKPTMKGQLFQDTVQKPAPNIPINARGV